MNSVTPVVPGLEKNEFRLGEGQPAYNPLPVLRYKGPRGEVLHRWTFTKEEREAIANGADLFAWSLTFNNPFTPISFAVFAQADVKPELFDGDLEERVWSCGRCVQEKMIAENKPTGERIPEHHRFCEKRLKP